MRLGRPKRPRAPTLLPPRNVAAEPIPAGGGSEVFEHEDAQEINRARMNHVKTLGLDLHNKTVLDVGCGVGYFSEFLRKQGCLVHALDAREENLAIARSRFPAIETVLADIETVDISALGTFDIVFSYGLIYHLENPIAGLRNMAKATRHLLLIETMICDHDLPLVRLVDETKSANQALRGLGVRPSPSFLALALNRIGFDWVYTAEDGPDHPDFRFLRKNNLDVERDGHALREIFLASRTTLDHPGLRVLVSGP